MKKLVLLLGCAGAVWMLFVISYGSPRLAYISNYLGMYCARWVKYRGIAPSELIVQLFNAWLVLTSALEWIACGLAVRSIARYFSRTLRT